MTVGYSVDVEYIPARGMWCVTLYIHGMWEREDWFHTELAARQWAAVVKANGA